MAINIEKNQRPKWYRCKFKGVHGILTESKDPDRDEYVEIRIENIDIPKGHELLDGITVPFVSLLILSPRDDEALEILDTNPLADNNLELVRRGIIRRRI